MSDSEECVKILAFVSPLPRFGGEGSGVRGKTLRLG